MDKNRDTFSPDLLQVFNFFNFLIFFNFLKNFDAMNNGENLMIFNKYEETDRGRDRVRQRYGI